MDPEDVALRDPDVIFTGTPGGYCLKDASKFQKLRDEIPSRTELAGTTAVKNGGIYIVIWDVAGIARKKFAPSS